MATLSSWFRWLEDEDVTVGNPAARIRRSQRHGRPQPWLNRNELTDLLAAAEDDGGDAYALVCLLGLNGPRVSEACNVDITDLGGSRYQPTLRILGKGAEPAEVVLTPAPSMTAKEEVQDGSCMLCIEQRNGRAASWRWSIATKRAASPSGGHQPRQGVRQAGDHAAEPHQGRSRPT